MYNYNLVKDESGKVTDILVNDRPVKRGSMRGFKKAQTTNYWKLFDHDRTCINPFSGVPCDLNALEASIYTFVKMWEQRYEIGGEQKAQVSTQTFDDMRYFLNELNREAYMDLLD